MDSACCERAATIGPSQSAHSYRIPTPPCAPQVRRARSSTSSSMPRAAKKKAPPEGTTEPEAQRPRPEELPTSFEVDEKAVTSLLDDPWHVSRRGVVIKPFTIPHLS